MTRRRIAVRTRCVADSFAAPNQRIVEYGAVTDRGLSGGLISFTLLPGPNGKNRLIVELYREDADVEIRCAAKKGG